MKKNKIIISKLSLNQIKRPRLAVYRSSKSIYAQLIDDQKQQTLVSASDRGIKEKMTKAEKAAQVGQLIAQKAKEKKVIEVRFDRRHYQYHGRVKSLAEAARKGGLKF